MYWLKVKEEYMRGTVGNFMKDKGQGWAKMAFMFWTWVVKGEKKTVTVTDSG